MDNVFNIVHGILEENSGHCLDDTAVRKALAHRITLALTGISDPAGHLTEEDRNSDALTDMTDQEIRSLAYGTYLCICGDNHDCRSDGCDEDCLVCV